MTNPWTEVPLADYEKHMSHPTVGQLDLMASLTKKYFNAIKPTSCIFLGVAGGNGLEHIDPNITTKVIGIDINQEYLDATFRRHATRLKSLHVVNVDIVSASDTINRVELIWAALIFEYAGIDNAFKFCRNNLLEGSHLIATIQSNRGATSVSPTGIESIKKVGGIFQPVDQEALLTKASESGFVVTEREENELPNGKSLLTFNFRMSAP